MKKRSVAVVLLLSVVTCGLYSIFWFVDTKHEMVRKGAQVPSAAWLFVPIVNLWWTWQWAGGVEHVTRGSFSQARAFLAVFLLNAIGLAARIEPGKFSDMVATFGVLLLNSIGMAVVQAELNKAIDEELSGGLPQARVA